MNKVIDAEIKQEELAKFSTLSPEERRKIVLELAKKSMEEHQSLYFKLAQ